MPLLRSLDGQRAPLPINMTLLRSFREGAAERSTENSARFCRTTLPVLTVADAPQNSEKPGLPPPSPSRRLGHVFRAIQIHGCYVEIWPAWPAFQMVVRHHAAVLAVAR